VLANGFGRPRVDRPRWMPKSYHSFTSDQGREGIGTSRRKGCSISGFTQRPITGFTQAIVDGRTPREYSKAFDLGDTQRKGETRRYGETREP
jgi:hypothetical protein